MTNWIIRQLDGIDDEGLRRAAVRILLWSTFLGTVNVALYVAKFIDSETLILITLILSWLALQFTCALAVIQTDIKKTIDDQE
jgi:hypothetical protein